MLKETPTQFFKIQRADTNSKNGKQTFDFQLSCSLISMNLSTTTGSSCLCTITVPNVTLSVVQLN